MPVNPPKGLRPVIEGRISDALWDASIGAINADHTQYGTHRARVIVHLIDSVSRGYTTPGEAYEAINAPYIPAWVYVCRSLYENVI